MPHREGSLFGPTMLTYAYLYLGRTTPHMCGGVCGVCGGVVVLGMWLPCGCVGCYVCHDGWCLPQTCTRCVLCGPTPWSLHPTQACQASHHVPLPRGVVWCHHGVCCVWLLWCERGVGVSFMLGTYGVCGALGLTPPSPPLSAARKTLAHAPMCCVLHGGCVQSTFGCVVSMHSPMNGDYASFEHALLG